MDKENEELLIYNPLWMKILVVIGLPLLILLGLWLISRILWEPNISIVQYSITALLGAGVLYQCSIGSRCLKYLNYKIIIDDNGAKVISSKGEKFYPWESLEMIEYSFATTTKLMNEAGQTIVYLMDSIPNLSVLKLMFENEDE